MLKKMKFSDCVNEFVLLWIDWMSANNIAIDNKQDYKTRREAAIRAERFIKKRYKLVQTMDNYFSDYE